MTTNSFADNTVKNLAQAHRLLSNISKIITILNQKGTNLNSRLDEILKVLLGYLEVEQGSIMVMEKSELVVLAASRPELVGLKQSLDGGSIAAWVAKSAKPIFIPDISKDKRFPTRGGKVYKKNSVLSAPVIQEDKLLGVINVTDKEGANDLLQEDVTYLLDFSSMIISILVQQKLQNELRRQKENLKKKNKELRRQEKLRDELYQMLVHDMKAPLAEVVANLDILSYSIQDDSREFLESAQMGCDRTVRMVSNLVAINKIEDGKLKPYKEEIDIKILLEESYSALKGLAKMKGIKLILDIPKDIPTVYLDRILILRVLQNLLTNAIGHTHPNTTITIGSRKVSGKKRVEFFVQDQGPGIAEEKRSSIFDKYSRLSDKKDALVGTGLGLYFCKLAIDVHRGKIGIDSSPGQGSRFYFNLAI